MESGKILIVIINYNGEAFLPDCLPSLVKQDYQNKEIVMIDNGSNDASLDITRKFLGIEIIENPSNNGYSGAADQACHLAHERGAEFVMLLNPDIVFTENYISKVIEAFRNDETIGAAQGKLLQYNFIKKQPTGKIDSTGLAAFKSRRFVDRGQGEKDTGQYNTSQEVFGVTGACPIYRMAHLEELKVDNEYFDTSFFMYKEDIDISWRLLLAGYKNYYIADAIAYHGRGTGVVKRSNLWEIAQNRKKLSKLAKYHSYKNQRIMQLKNEIPSHFLISLPQMIFKEVAFLGYILIKEPQLIKSFFELLQSVPRAYRKRGIIQKKRVKNADEVAKWFQ